MATGPAPRPAALMAGPTIDAIIHELAARQHGIVARWQLEEAGVPGHRIDYRLRTRRLHPVHRGVYRVGPVAAAWSHEMAAVLAAGSGSVVSHRSAAAVWEIAPRRSPAAPVDISTANDVRRPGRGIRVHRVSSLRDDETTRRHELFITTPARTLMDLAGCVDLRDLERAVARAQRGGLVDLPALEALLLRHARRRGSRKLRAVLGIEGGPAFTRSQAEVLFLELIRRGELPPPRVNTLVRGLEVDFLWPAHRLIVEIDGFAFHSGTEAFERDHDRDVTLVGAGFQVLRFTWRMLTEKPDVVLVRVTEALTRAAMTGAGGPRP